MNNNSGKAEPSPLIRDDMAHKIIDSFELRKRREAAGLSQGEFAGRCGWSQVWQHNLELPGEHKITTKTAERILEVLTKLS